jgi:hypothetical protein
LPFIAISVPRSVDGRAGLEADVDDFGPRILDPMVINAYRFI